MIAPRVSLKEQLESRTAAQLRGIDNSLKAALRNGDTKRATEYDKMRTYLSEGKYFDASFVAARIGERQRSRDLRGLMDFSYVVRGPVPRGPPE